ncbi:MAG: TetR/AcrR family transcriptional regulator [Acidimicrobiales bacterium]
MPQATTRPDKQSRGRPRDGTIDAAVLDATEMLLARRGYEAMSIEQVAAAAGVSKPTIYLRYPSKRELVAAMIDRLRPPLPETSGDSVTRDLIALIDIQREWVDRHGLRIVAAVLLEQVDHPELLERFQERVIAPVRAAFAAVLKRGIGRGHLRRGADRPEVIDALTGAFWAESISTTGHSPDWTRRLVETLLQGLAAGSPAHPDGRRPRTRRAR